MKKKGEMLAYSIILQYIDSDASLTPPLELLDSSKFFLSVSIFNDAGTNFSIPHVPLTELEYIVREQR